MEIGGRFLTNGAARSVVLNGRKFLVAPMTILVPGVLNGSRGPLLYPEDEVAAQPGVWNHVAIVVNHPTHPISNAHLSAHEDGVIEKQGIGFLVNDRIEDGKRRADGYFDVEKTRNVDKRILNALESGKQIEVSTGLHTENEAQEGTYNGKPYTYIARNYRPDHLAILPDQKGACSNDDGCGVNNTCNHEGMKGKYCANCGAKMTANEQPSDKIDPDKACKILHDKQANGKPLTDQQRKMFGAACGSKTENTMNREQLVESLVTNCDCFQGQEEVLNGMPVENLKKLLKKIAVVNAVKADGALITNADGSFRVTAEDTVEVVNADDGADAEPDSDEDDFDEMPKKKGKKKMAKNFDADETNSARPTLAELLVNASDEDRETWENAVAINKAAKQQLIDRLVANSRDKKAAAAIYAKMHPKELKQLVDNLPPTRNAQREQTYVGAAPAVNGYGGGHTVEQADILDIPTMNWDEDK